MSFVNKNYSITLFCKRFKNKLLFIFVIDTTLINCRVKRILRYSLANKYSVAQKLHGYIGCICRL